MMGLYGDEPETLDTFPGFERFWKMYPSNQKHPRRCNRKWCSATWKRRKLESIAEQIIARLRSLKTSKQWEDMQMVPLMKTFLNAEPWNDADPAEQERDMARHKRMMAEEAAAAEGNPLIGGIGKPIPPDARQKAWLDASDWWRKEGSKRQDEWRKHWREQLGMTTNLPFDQLLPMSYKDHLNGGDPGCMTAQKVLAGQVIAERRWNAMIEETKDEQAESDV